MNCLSNRRELYNEQQRKGLPLKNKLPGFCRVFTTLLSKKANDKQVNKTTRSMNSRTKAI